MQEWWLLRSPSSFNICTPFSPFAAHYTYSPLLCIRCPCEQTVTECSAPVRDSAQLSAHYCVRAESEECGLLYLSELSVNATVVAQSSLLHLLFVLCCVNCVHLLSCSQMSFIVTADESADAPIQRPSRHCLTHSLDSLYYVCVATTHIHILGFSNLTPRLQKSLCPKSSRQRTIY